MPNVHFSFRRGAGDVPEILYGKVEFKPTLAFARGTSLVLPAPTTLDLVNGEATANNVYPTPAPVAGQVEWAYRVKAIDTRGQSFEWMVGVPDSTGTVEFASLPRYFETKPPLFGKGEKGDPGEAAKITVGTTTSGTTPSVTNSGTNQNAILNFVLPQGPQGPKGDGTFDEYRSANGQAPYRQVSEGPNTYPKGFITGLYATAEGWPHSPFSNVTTFSGAYGASKVQIATPYNGATGEPMIRYGLSSTTWTPFKPLRGDLATTTANGLMSSADKSKLDGIGTLAYASKKASDLANSYPEGTTVGAFKTADGWPVVSGGDPDTVTVKTEVPRGYPMATQWAYAYKNDTAELEVSSPVMYRQGFGTLGWGAWQTLATTNYVDQKISYITPEQFGAVGDGVKDDTQALTAAIAEARGRKLVCRSGAKYLVSSTIENGGEDVHIVGNRAQIIAASQGFKVLDFGSTSTGITVNLTAGQTVSGNGWKVDNSTNIVPGQIAIVKSSKSWYYDPRPESSDARKSEVHIVQEVVGNTVFMEDSANDGYDINSEAVTLTFYNPIRVFIDNLTILAPLPSYGASTPSSTGITITRASSPLLTNINIEGTAYTGLHLRECYNSKVSSGTIKNCNYVKTGYGISTYGSAKTLIFGVTFSGCRRGVDFSGGNIISRFSTVDSCINLGGGRESTGLYYGWGPSGAVGIQNYGFGSHGAADNSIYRNNITSACQMPYSLRGRNEFVLNNVHIGRTRNGFVAAITGSNLTVKGNRVGPSYWGKTTGNYDGGGGIVTRRCDYFVQFHAGYDTSTTNVIDISGNSAEVSDAFILFDAGAVPKGPTMIASNNCELLSAAIPSLAFLKHLGALEEGLFRWAVVSNYYYKQGGSSTLALTENLNLVGAKRLDFTVSGATT